MTDLTLINHSGPKFVRQWYANELAQLALWPNEFWWQEDDRLCHPNGDRLHIAEVGYILWNELGDFEDITFTNLGQALLYINNT